MIEGSMVNQFDQKIANLFKNFYWLQEGVPVLVGRIPNEIRDEIDQFTNKCIELKTHPLYFLKNHANIGKNKFQVSVPNILFEDSFTFAYIIYLGSFFMAKVNNCSISDVGRKVTVRRNMGHFDHYDFWVNFVEPGDINNWHTHAGSLSGVIYVNNDIALPTLFKDGAQFNGTKGDIILFPSYIEHMVETNNTDTTRVTYAFNLNVSE